MKYPILFGWPLLRYGLDYKDNIIIDLLWVYCLLLMIKDLVYRFILKKSYCDTTHCSSQNHKK